MIIPQPRPRFQLQNEIRVISQEVSPFFPQKQIKRRSPLENNYACNKKVGFLAIYMISLAPFTCDFIQLRCTFISFWYYLKTIVNNCEKESKKKKMILHSTALK